jgi:hypothetical protein
MITTKIKHIGAVALLSSTLFFTACTPEKQAFVSGATVGVVAASVYSYPYYYNRPYYYHGGRYYYGGYYHGGYYHYHGHRFHSGHYYHNGYRYYNGHRYRAQVGRHGYYANRSQYNNRSYYRGQTRKVNHRQTVQRTAHTHARTNLNRNYRTNRQNVQRSPRGSNKQTRQVHKRSVTRSQY